MTSSGNTVHGDNYGHVGSTVQNLSYTFTGPVNPPPIRHAALRRAFDPLVDERTCLFAGRAAALQRIDMFIQDPAGGVLVITAPAGFGKTSLLAYLVHGRREVYAYHFFTPLYGQDSLREDFFLRSVVQQLEQWHADPQPLPTDLAELRGRYHELLGRPLEQPRVLLLDGLDEVTTWDLRPYLSRRLPPHLHLIAAMRDMGQDVPATYQLPTAQVQHYRLEGMPRDDVAAVLRAAGERAIPFAEDAALLDQIVRMAAYEDDPRQGADPFYIRLLAEDAAAGKLNAVSLADQPSGLTAYLDHWWQELGGLVADDNQAIQDVLSILVVALGPIQRVDLEVLVPRLTQGWRRNRLGDIIATVRRWVGGDNERGYALTHPRFRRYLQTQIQTEPYLDTLLAHCAHWPEHGSPYALA